MSEDISDGLHNIAANYSDADDLNDLIVVPNKVDTVVIEDDSMRMEDVKSASRVDNAGGGFYPRQPQNWMSMPPPNRFRGRGYGPHGPRGRGRGRGNYRGRGGQRYTAPPPAPSYDNRPVPAPSYNGPPPAPCYDNGPTPAPSYDSRPVPSYDNRPVPSYDNRPPPAPSYDNGPPPAPNYDNRPVPTRSYDNGPPPAPSYDNRPVPSYDNGPLPAPSYDNGPPPVPSYDNGPPPVPSYDNGPVPARSYDNGPPPAPRYDNGPPPTPSYDNGPVPSYDNGPPPAPNYDNRPVPAPNYDNRPVAARGYDNRPVAARGYDNGPPPAPSYDTGPPSGWAMPSMSVPPPTMVPSRQPLMACRPLMAGPPPMPCPPPMAGPSPMPLMSYGPVPNMPPPSVPAMPFGQPPPYSASVPNQNMPPPEIWVETMTGDGSSYFYHARTRQTTWDRPVESPMCHIFTYEQCEVMADNGTLPEVLQGLIMQNSSTFRPTSAPNGSGVVAPAPAPAMFSVPPPTWPTQPTQAMQPMQPMQGAQLRVSNEDQQMSNMFNATEIPAQFTHPPPWNRLNGLSLDGGYQAERGPPRSSEDHAAVTGPTFTQPPNGVAAQGGRGGGGAWSAWAPHASADTPHKYPAHDVAQLPQMQHTPAPHHANPPQTRVYPERVSSQPDRERPKFIPIRMPPPRRKRTTISDELKKQAEQWTRHKSPEGREYYYNESEKTSVWVKPDVLKKFDELTKKMAKEAEEEEIFRSKIIEIIDLDKETDEDEESASTAAVKQEDQRLRTNPEVNKEVHIEVAPEKMAAEVEVETTDKNERLHPEVVPESETIEQVESTQVKEVANKTEQEKPAPTPAPEENVHKEKGEEKERDKEDGEKKKKNCNLPMWITHVAGTPWHVVWTAEGTMFFFNPTRTPSSVWARPAELMEREDVETIINYPPEAIVKARTKHALAKASTESSSNGDLKRSATSDSDSSDNEELSKKIKVIQDKKQAKKLNSTSTTIPSKKQDPSPMSTSPSEGNSSGVKEVTIYGDIPMDQRVKAFRQMLADCQVSAFATWEKEQPKIVTDKRHLLLSAEERQQEFDKYVMDKLQAEVDDCAAAAELRKRGFVALMVSAKLHSKSSFLEFSATHGADPRYLAVERARSREMYFTEYLIELKRKEREERETRRDQAKYDFNSMLRENGVDRHSRWLDVRSRIEEDPRYTAVESSAIREDYFKDFTRSLKEERRKDKEKNGKKEKKDKKLKKLNEKNETEKKQRTPPPEQWADIIGVPENRRPKPPATVRLPTELQLHLIEDKNLPLIKRRHSFTIPVEDPKPEISSPKRLRSCRFPSPAKLPLPVKPRATKTAIKVMDKRKNRTNGDISPNVKVGTRRKKTEKE